MAEPRRSGQKHPASRGAILVINSGSSSVKFALFAADETLSRLWSGAIERIGLGDGRIHALDSDGRTAIDEDKGFADHDAALGTLMESIDRRSNGLPLTSVGHRIVHGGPDCDCPVIVTAEVEARLRELIPLAPLHQPHNLAGIAAVRRMRPDLPQIACFDTAFHNTMPRLATLTALPRKFHAEGVRRYGFHGLSYESVTDTLRADGVEIDRERVIIAHLGSGASMCALKGGRSVETTMGFSTLAGLPMGTRCGDLDPGILLYLLVKRGLTVERVERLLYEESGLLGVSGLTRNMEDLIAQRADRAANEAIELFCYQASKHVGALTAALGGIDRLVFTGGIGTNAPLVREKICEPLAYLGFDLDAGRNVRGERVLSTDSSSVVVGALPTDEELTIARHVQAQLKEPLAAQEA